MQAQWEDGLTPRCQVLRGEEGQKLEHYRGYKLDGALESGWKGDFNELSTSGSVGIYELYETDRKLSSMLNPAVHVHVRPSKYKAGLLTGLRTCTQCRSG
jgi:hypothetical protein